ncbi:MAG TPA: hypothetical protein VH583_22270 [Vicinamibacterales bacterium]
MLPTLNQLKRKNANVVMMWFARGRLWASQEHEHDDFARRKQRKTSFPKSADRHAGERRGRDWRPGGDHKDPRARFDKRKKPDHQKREAIEQSRSRDRWPKTGARPKPLGDRHAHGAKRPQNQFKHSKKRHDWRQNDRRRPPQTARKPAAPAFKEATGSQPEQPRTSEPIVKTPKPPDRT